MCFKEVNSLKYTSQCSLLNTRIKYLKLCAVKRLNRLSTFPQVMFLLTLQLCCPSKSIIFKHKKSSFDPINKVLDVYSTPYKKKNPAPKDTLIQNLNNSFHEHVAVRGNVTT